MGDEVPKIGFFEHFLRNQSLKVSHFLNDDKRQWGTSFEYGAIFGKTLNRD